MSNITFTTNQFETPRPLPHRGMQLGLTPESHYSNLSLSPSPDSSSTVSIQSDREASSSPDINMQECSPNEVDKQHTIVLQGNVFCYESMNLDQSFIATPVNGSVSFWNENLSLISNQEPSSVEYQTLSEDGSSSVVTSPDSGGGQSQLTSSETSRRGSTENDSSSVSSTEMVMRRNSFCLADQSLLVISSLDESSPGHPTLPSESDLWSPCLQNVFEKSTEKLLDENADSPHLGMTFNFPTEPQTKESYMNATKGLSYVPMPSENEGDLLMTFAYETSPDSGKEANSGAAEVDTVSNFHGEFTPEQGIAFVTILSAIQNTDKDIQTSTPVQNIGNKISGLPPLSESPCTENTGSAGPFPTKGLQTSPKQCSVAGLLSSASKVKKVEIKRFPKSDFSNVKSKVVTRNHQVPVPGPARQHKPTQVNVNGKNTDSLNGASSRMSPAKVRRITAGVSAAKRDSDPQRRASAGPANSAVSSSYTAGNGQCKGGASTAGNKHALAVPRSRASSETEQIDSSQVAESTTQHTGNQTFCLSSFEKSPDRGGQTDPKPTPKKGVSNKIEVRPGSALGQGKTPLLKTRPRCLSELSSSSRPPREKKTTVRFPTSFTIHKPDIHRGKTKAGNLNGSSHSKTATQASAGTAENSPREVKKISLVTDSGKAAGATLDDNGRSRGRPSPRRARPATLAQTPVPSALSAKQRQEGFTKAINTLPLKQKSNSGIPRDQTTSQPSLGSALAARIKPQLNGFRPPQGQSLPSSTSCPPIPTTRLLRKTSGLSRSQTEDSVLSESARSTQVSGGPAQKTTSLKTTVVKTRLTSTSGKNTGSTFSTSCKSTASTTQGQTVNLLKRTGSSRFARLTSSGTVDKNRAKASARQQQPQQQASQLNQTKGPPDVVPAGVAETEGKDQGIQQLKGLLAASNCRFEAVAIVLQQILNERDEATRQCRELSQELVSLQGKLVSSVHSSERLEKEKEELRVSLENALQRLQEQHQKDLEEVEQRLQAFYQAEWDKVHLTYQAEADKCKTLMEKQMGDLKAEHEAMKLELESSHAEQLQGVKQQHEKSLEELRKIHSQELESLDKSLKDAEAALSGQIRELTEENGVLIEKLTAEENKRRELAEKSQKDSHTVYLEQELESLKVVVDIKNKQLHQQEKKLMEIDKLTEKNVKLDESLKKVQQENEDLKARMERHAALSRQLSTEQAMLHESLQKESKVNKRLSMENEELLWKLHNGDLSSPHKVSPTATSPSHSFSLQSPRNSSVFSSHPSSPR